MSPGVGGWQLSVRQVLVRQRMLDELPGGKPGYSQAPCLVQYQRANELGENRHAAYIDIGPIGPGVGRRQ